MSDVTIAYFPIIGRGEQIRLICAMHSISVSELASTPLGEDFDKDKAAPFGTVPWMKDHANGLELNDSLAIVQYLVTKYDGPLTPKNCRGCRKDGDVLGLGAGLLLGRPLPDARHHHRP